MKNEHEWLPTKYSVRKGKLIASRNPLLVGVTSRLYADLTASQYNTYIPLHVKGHLVDLGCGNVPLHEAYKNLITKSTCVDWPNSTHENKYVDVPCDLNQPLPFGDSTFDTIIISDVLEHIAQPDLLWSEMARILKPFGKILVSVPFLYRIHEAPYDYYRYTEFALRNFVDKNRLKIVELKTLGGLPEVLTDMIAKNVVRVPLIGTLSAKILQKLCTLFLKTSSGKKVSEKTGKIFPLGYFIVVQKPSAP
jgi:SAM-dependent methyltransferase